MSPTFHSASGFIWVIVLSGQPIPLLRCGQGRTRWRHGITTRDPEPPSSDGESLRKQASGGCPSGHGSSAELPPRSADKLGLLLRTFPVRTTGKEAEITAPTPWLPMRRGRLEHRSTTPAKVTFASVPSLRPVPWSPVPCSQRPTKESIHHRSVAPIDSEWDYTPHDGPGAAGPAVGSRATNG